ncbi:MAG TPA: hypothetical protein VME24_00625 [Alphaproteobacteria bacterium]|nr:hypothetical protein [Alphaproteobacteria bacterium]
MDDLIAGLPGESLVRQGLADVHAGRQTAEAYLVRIARPRLSRAGLLTGVLEDLPADAELCLYRLLRAQGGDAYSRYNALLRELVSFEQALDRRMQKFTGRGQRLKEILEKGRAEREPLLSDEEVARELQERRGRFH